jgi:outer membrane protein insertion porin family
MRYLSAIGLIQFICLISIQHISAQQQQQTPLVSDTTIEPLVQKDSTGLIKIHQDTLPPVTSLNPNLLNIFNQTIPKKYKITAISVTGNNYFDQNLLLSIAGLSVGDEVSLPGGDNFSKAINKLWTQNYFSDVAIYITSLKDNGITVEVQVTERPRLSKFEFTGIKKSEKDDLTPKTGLVINRVITENLKRTSVDAIKKFYADKGYRSAEVSIREIPDTSNQNSSILVFNIDKGSKVKIAEINFIDNTIGDDKLKSQMKGTKEKGHLTLFPAKYRTVYDDSTQYNFHDYMHDWGFLSPSKTKEILEPYIKIKPFASAKFDAKKYEEDKDKIISYYNSLGYRDATIIKDTSITAKDGLHLYMQVDEGHKYYFGNIGFSNATKYSDSLLIALLGIKKGDTYNRDILDKKLGITISPEGGDISGLYMDDGYLFFHVDPVETAVYNDTIDYDIKMYEGPQATFKNIKISGNDRTKEYVIRRELRTLPGEKFSRTDVIRSQREIANLGFFNQEKIVPDIVPDQDNGTVDLTWQVEEKSGDQLELSAGFGGGIGVTGTLGVTFNNFSAGNLFRKGGWKDGLPVGDGQKLSLRVQSNGRAYRSYNASFTEPWLGGKKRNAFSVSVYDTKFANAYNPLTGQYEKLAADTSFFRTTGFSIGLSKQLKWPDDYFSAGVSFEYARYQLKNYYIDPTNLPGFNNGFSNNISLKFTLQRYSEDQQIFPRTGSNFLLTLQATPPFSLIDKNVVNWSNPYTLIEYYKWRFTGEWFVPLGKPTGPDRNKQFVLKLAAKYGYIGRYNPDLSISPFERFQVGDAGLSNSYALLGYDIVSHRGYPVYQSSDPRVNPDQQGASEYFTIFNKYTLELRYPFALNPSSTIYAETFFEAANGWYSFRDYNPFRLRRSVGVGVRFFLPMFGLLGFDYGIGLDRYNPGDGLKNAGRFTFMLGYEPD